MTPIPLRAALRVLAASAALTVVPAAADAATWTVDDDLAQCPNASFTSIQTAVDFAAPWDTILVCDGLYQEKSTPLNGISSPSQPGSRNGLTIQKPLTIKGTGASKVIIEPAAELGDSLAGTVPYLRDGGGNVITIARQSLGASDDNENSVDISGVTVRSPYAYAEAGIAYFNTSGTVSKSVVGPLKRASADETTNRPHGWGVIQTNFLQGTGGGSGTVRREVSVVDSLVTGYSAGGILFDGARGADGTPESAARAGIVQYGNVIGTKVVGGGSGAAIPQTGVKYFAGTRGEVSGSTIQNNTAFSTVTGSVYQSYGVYLGDSENAPIGSPYPTYPTDPSDQGLTVTGNAFLGNRVGLYNADLAGTAIRTGAPVLATDNYWGCSLGPVVGNSNSTVNNAAFGCQGISGNDAGSPAKASVVTAPFQATVPDTLVVPVATDDAAPTVSFTEPIGSPELKVGEILEPVIIARDDFGVTSVMLAADGSPLATLKKAPYEFGWSPTAADAGKTVELSATATDSSGQTTTESIFVKVTALPVDPPTPPTPPTPAAPKPPVNTASPVIVGDVTVGDVVSCLPGTWLAEPTAYRYTWLRAGTPIAGATAASYEVAKADTASLLSCSVTATNADGAASAASSARLVTFPIDAGDEETERQIGPGIVTVLGSVKASTKTGKATIGEFECLRAIGGSCTVTVTGSVKIGSRSYGFPKVTVTGAGVKSLEIVLSKSARSALKRRSGTLSLTIAATDATGFKSSWKTSTAIKKK